MLIADFVESFHKKLYDLALPEHQRELEKHARTVKNSLLNVVGSSDKLLHDQAIKLQEAFHIRIDRMAMDYATWERGGRKGYARPAQFVSRPVASLAKKAFDWVLHEWLVSIQPQDSQEETS